MEQLIFWSEEPHVRTCPSPEKEKGSPAMRVIGTAANN